MQGHHADVGSRIDAYHAGRDVPLNEMVDGPIVRAKGDDLVVHVEIGMEEKLHSIAIAMPAELVTLWSMLSVGLMRITAQELSGLTDVHARPCGPG